MVGVSGEDLALGSLRTKHGVNVQTTDRMFAWALRHPTFLLSAYAKTEAGLMSSEPASGGAEMGELALFDETILMKVSNDLLKGRTAMRWIQGVWVVTQPNNRGHVVLASSGGESHRARGGLGQVHARAGSRAPLGRAVSFAQGDAPEPAPPTSEPTLGSVRPTRCRTPKRSLEDGQADAAEQGPKRLRPVAPHAVGRADGDGTSAWPTSSSAARRSWRCGRRSL